MSNKIAVFCTASSLTEAKSIAKAVVEEELAACATILPPVASIYRWKGRVEEAEETLMIIKTRQEQFLSLRTRILELHSYEVPEIIAVPIVAGHPAYLEWIDQSTGNL